MRYVFLLLFACSSLTRALAQQPATRPLVISPVVGASIDSQEKATYELFPEYSTKEFSEARFEQHLAPDSAITVRTTLIDGRTIISPMTALNFVNMRLKIEEKARRLSSGAGVAISDSVGRMYRVVLRSGTTFAGTLRSARPQELEFTTDKPGSVLIARSQITSMQLVPAVEAADAQRHPDWGYVGNGTRVFFAPTARGLRAGEGYAQTIDVLLLGANVGITDNFSFGVLFSAIPGLGLGNQLFALTPKISVPIRQDWHVGAGVLYMRVPTFDDSYSSGYGTGIAYGLSTYGSADNNLTLGLGYGFSGGGTDQGFGKSPVLVVSGATRVSKRLSLMSENYLLTSGSGGLGGLYGIRLNWPRTTLGIGSFYVAPFDGEGAFGYLYPVYLDLSLRFGKTAQK